MALPVIALAGAAGLAWWMFSGAKKTGGGGGGGTLPGGGGGGGGGGGSLGDPVLDQNFQIMPNGVVAAKPGGQAFILQQLAQKAVTPVQTPDGFTVRLVALGSFSPSGAMNEPAASWIPRMAKVQGRHVLCAINGQELLRSCAPGEEVALCNANIKQWALLVEAVPAGATASPGGGGGGGAGPTIPGSIVIPTVPGTEQGGGGGGGAPPPGGGGGWGLPDLGSVLGQIPGLGIPGTGTAPGVPAPGGGTTTPGVPGGVGGVLPSPDGTGWLYTLRPGDIASKMAQWYTGNFMRALEIPPINPGMHITGSGATTQFVPWNAGQIVKLPLDWNVAKGLPPLQSSPAQGGGGAKTSSAGYGDTVAQAKVLAAGWGVDPKFVDAVVNRGAP